MRGYGFWQTDTRVHAGPFVLPSENAILRFYSIRESKTRDIIPPEQKLCSELGVSRGTVRMAIGELVQEGILRREQGRGTFIVGPRLEKSLLAYFKFAERDTSEEIIPESKILKIENVSPPLEVAQALEITSKETVVRIKRLRTVRGVPFIFQVSFFPKTVSSP